MLQYLHGYTLLRTALQATAIGCGARVASDLGRFMGETHRQTHAALLPEAQRAALEARFRNAEMCAITAEVRDHGRGAHPTHASQLRGLVGSEGW